MKVFNTSQVNAIDHFTIQKEPIESIDLMERASMSFVKWFMRKFDSSRTVMVFSGPGNNGGDGLAIARLLGERFFKVEVCLLKFGSGFSKDCQENLERLGKTNIPLTIIENSSGLPEITKQTIVVDAIFGSGLSRKVEGFPASVIRAINSSGASIVSVDIPSGLFGEDNRGNDMEAVVRAGYTITFEFPFLSFFFSENEAFIGEWKAVTIGLHPQVIRETPASHEIITRAHIKSFLKTRSSFSHKGSFGHALLIAGCDGMMGAAVLATRACLRTGAGLVTAHVPRKTYPIIQMAAPEALLSIDESDILFTGVPDLSRYTAVAAGPGLNCRTNTGKGLEKLLKEVHVPLVLDADALNILAARPGLMDLLPENTILTPHPKEFDRLFGVSENAFERHQKQVEVSEKRKLIIVLKGAFTMISIPGGITHINTTGNPGMATGGSGDVLTGMILALLAQGYNQEESACLGVYLHGLAADLAMGDQSQESLIPGDIIDRIGKAFKFTAANNKN